MPSNKSGTSGKCQWTTNVIDTLKISSKLYLDRSYITGTCWKKKVNTGTIIGERKKKGKSISIKLQSTKVFANARL